MRYCEICGSKKQEQIFEDVVICNNCQFAYNAYCTQSERTAYYKEMEKKSYYITNLPTSPLYLKQQRSTAQFIKKYMDGLVLDVGCFTGEIMKLLNTTVEGIDPSETAVDIAKGKGLPVMWGDIFEYEFDKKYDTIILSHVLEHIVDLRKFVLIISELLDKDGIVILEVPDATKFTLETKSTFINDQREPLLQFSYEHVNYFTPYSLKNLFVNFTIVSCEHVTTTLHTIRMVLRKKYDELIKPSLEEHVRASYAELERMNQIINKHDEPIYVWGFGAFTHRLLKYTTLGSCDIKGFIDRVSKKESYKGIPIIKEPILDIPILIGTFQYKDYVKEKYKSYRLIEL